MLDVGAPAQNSLGSFQEVFENLRAHNPMDLTWSTWKKNNPKASFDDWAGMARGHFMACLNYNPGPLDLKPKAIERIETDKFIREKIEFNTTPWFRVPGYFFTPKNVKLPAPAIVLFHEWGGPMLFGADRLVGEPVHPIVTAHRKTYTSGRPLADWFAEQGFAVIIIDNFHFGKRIPMGLKVIPEKWDPTKFGAAQMDDFNRAAGELLMYLTIRHVYWAGTTWCGLNYWDDSRCIDYLATRKEVDINRVGCTGLSGGGWRTNIMAALEPRIKAAISVGWMTTGDTQQAYNVGGGVGVFNMVPGAWNRMDIPDLMAMAPPKAVMTVVGTKDYMIPPKGREDSGRQIAGAYQWAGCPDRYRHWNPDKEHCYDADVQEEAVGWFRKYL